MYVQYLPDDRSLLKSQKLDNVRRNPLPKVHVRLQFYSENRSLVLIAAEVADKRCCHHPGSTVWKNLWHHLVKQNRRIIVNWLLQIAQPVMQRCCVQSLLHTVS